MAKMIKCPTCGTQIEVPPQASGQIVKCPGCGKGLKLVAKPKPGAPPAGQQHAGAGLGGHPGGSVSGSSVSAMTFVGETPPAERPGPALDDLPSLDSNCAVCGRPVEPDDLIEDNGRLVCIDCVKGARSGMARPEGGAELIDFKPAGMPVRRGKLISFSPSFFIGVLAALILLGTQVYLTLFEKPVGTLTASTAHAGTTGVGGRNAAARAVPPGDPDQGASAAPTDGATTAPATTPDETNNAGATTAPSDATANATPSSGAPTDSTNPGSTPPSDGTAGAATSPTTNTAVAAGPPGENSTIFTDGPAGAAPKDGVAPGAADPGAAAPGEVPAAPAIQSSDPLQRGLERLAARDYAKAAGDLDTARLRYVVGKLPAAGMPLTPQQQMTLEGLAACYIGMGRVDAARGSLETAHTRNVRSRSLILNTGIYMVSGARQLNSMVQAAELVRTHMSHQQNDEYAADIFGTLVDKISKMPNAPKEKVDAWWTFHDNYIDALAARGDVGEAGKLKWGVDWLPADDVKNARLARGVANPAAGVEAAATDLKLAMQREQTAKITLKNAEAARAKGAAGDVEGAKSQVAAANAAVVKAKQALDLASAAVNTKKPRWLTKFEPVIPQQAVAP